MCNTLRVLTFTLLLASFASGQTVPDNKAAEDRQKLEKEAVAFLRETLGDVNAMRSLENRISFGSELASLMWFHDEREARAMYSGLIGDFKDLIAKYDSQMNEFGAVSEDAELSGGLIGFMGEPSERSRLLRKFSAAMAVGQQIAMSMAEHDADLAFGFYYDSLSSISNPELRAQAEAGRGSYFEFRLLKQIAETDPSKAAKFGLRSLSKGLTHEHVELLKKIYGKDAGKGADFGGAILSRLKSDKTEGKGREFYVLSSLINFGGETYDASRKPGGKRPVYDQSELRELAEILAKAILSRSDPEGFGYIHAVEKYLPGRAAQIRAKFKTSAGGSNHNAMTNAAYSAAMAMNAAANSYQYESGYSNVNSNGRYERERLAQEEREKGEQKLREDVQGLSTKQLPKEEREKIIAEARKIIMQTPGRDKKIVSLSMLAAQVSKLGDKELAAEIMRDAERLVNPAPKNYQDFVLTWMLASGYANADPSKAFPLLEETIGRANDTLAAFVKVGEFMDVAEEMIQDGEVQVGAFGGQMVRGLTSELGMAETTIQVLAKADFAKTKALTNRFDRQEIRVLAKMMVLRAVLNNKKEAKTEEMIEDGLTVEPDGGRK
jgi:hypothetical protein